MQSGDKQGSLGPPPPNLYPSPPVHMIPRPKALRAASVLSVGECPSRTHLTKTRRIVGKTGRCCHLGCTCLFFKKAIGFKRRPCCLGQAMAGGGDARGQRRSWRRCFPVTCHPLRLPPAPWGHSSCPHPDPWPWVGSSISPQRSLTSSSRSKTQRGAKESLTNKEHLRF